MVRIGKGDAGFCIDTHAPTADEVKVAPPGNGCFPSGTCPPSAVTTGTQVNTCVPWCLAKNYCASLGKRLCSVNELATACHDVNGYEFPWGQDAQAMSDVCFLGVFRPNAAISDCHPPDPPNKYELDLPASLEWTDQPGRYATGGGGSPPCMRLMTEVKVDSFRYAISFRCCADAK